MNPLEKTENPTLQKYLGNKGLVSFIVLMNMFVPLSTDLYLPSLPTMSSYFGSSSAVTNMTLSAFFICYALGILTWGPLSDKFGRKPIVLTGGVIYILSSIFCALSTNVYFLILARAMQGFGAGGITSSSVAMIKDSFSGKKREGILAVVQTLSGLAPMIAPVIGAAILQVVSWRGTFWLLAAISLVNLILTCLYQETLKEEERYKGTLAGSAGRLVHVARNKSFLVPTMIFSLSAIPFMGYIAVSSYVYVDYFGLSEQVYSYFFASNALVSLLGPTIYVKFLRKSNKKILTGACFGFAVAGGICVMTVGRLSPFVFLFSQMIMSLSMTTLRPFSTNLLLDQQKGDTGSAASLINTSWTVLGSVGMALASLPWNNIVVGLGTLITVFSLAAFVGWYGFIRSDIPCIGIKDQDFDKGMAGAG